MPPIFDNVPDVDAFICQKRNHLGELCDEWNTSTQGLRRYSDGTHYCNVALFGFSGQGKSSFVRSSLWLKELVDFKDENPNGRPQLPPVPVAGGIGSGEQCTTTYNPMTLLAHDDFTVTLGDIRGISSAEIEDIDGVFGELQRLAEGKIMRGETMSMDRSMSDRFTKLFQPVVPSLRVTQFVLVHRFDKVKKIFDTDHIGRWKCLLKKMRESGFKDPLIIITGCNTKPTVHEELDTNETVISRDMGRNYDPTSIESVRRYIQLTLNVDSNDIFFVENYMTNDLQGGAKEKEQTPAIALVRALSQAVKRGVIKR